MKKSELKQLIKEIIKENMEMTNRNSPDNPDYDPQIGTDKNYTDTNNGYDQGREDRADGLARGQNLPKEASSNYKQFYYVGFDEPSTNEGRSIYTKKTCNPIHKPFGTEKLGKLTSSAKT